MKTRLVLRVAMLLLVAGAVCAHGDKKHVVGTVEKINSNSVIVKTAYGKSVEVRLLTTTVYIERSGQEDKSAKLSDLAVGNRVVIHATPKGDGLEADEIRFSKPGASASAGHAAGSKP